MYFFFLYCQNISNLKQQRKYWEPLCYTLQETNFCHEISQLFVESSFIVLSNFMFYGRPERLCNPEMLSRTSWVLQLYLIKIYLLILKVIQQQPESLKFTSKTIKNPPKQINLNVAILLQPQTKNVILIKSVENPFPHHSIFITLSQSFGLMIMVRRKRKRSLPPHVFTIHIHIIYPSTCIHTDIHTQCGYEEKVLLPALLEPCQINVSIIHYSIYFHRAPSPIFIDRKRVLHSILLSNATIFLFICYRIWYFLLYFAVYVVAISMSPLESLLHIQYYDSELC